MLNMTIEEFAKRNPLYGFYMDLCGNYCCPIGTRLLTVFRNDDGNIDICVMVISDNGYDDVLDWITPETEEDARKTIFMLMKMYRGR